jgi:xanthine/CO dehydrogenase XdhC/CoxF family maturation factor/CTP:molybdopterin cytidylyltransferase MocA
MKHWLETADIAGRVVALAAAGRRGAIATVIRIEGSSYRRPGAKLLIEDDGRTLGGVSGGCLEADVRDIALEIIRSGTPRLLHYDTGADDRTVWGLGLGCNGSVDIFVQPATEPGTLESLREIRARLERASPFAISTIVEGPAGVGQTTVSDVGTPHARSRVDVDGSRTLFTEVLHPPPRLIVCGAGDDARPLVAFASAAGFAITVVDHRPAFLSAERFPSAKQLLDFRPDGDVGTLAVDARTLVVVKTHSFAHDRDWLKVFLETSASYIGILGPRARADEMLGQLGAGADPRVFAPVGLNIGADGPEQIAVSVVGELLAVISSQPSGHLRERNRQAMSTDRAGSVAGVVLAAGTSTRMGQNKLFMEIEGEPLVRRVVGRASKAGFDPLIVVLGHEAELVRQALEGIQYRPVLNPEYARGVNSSLRAGIRAVSETAARAAVVVLADMPFVTTAMIETVIGKYRKSDAPLVISDYDGVNAPPMLYDRSLFGELAASEEQGCGKHVVKRHRHEAESASWPVEALTDLDAPEDYARVKAAIESTHVDAR